jgi:hypothetical protein
VRIPIMFNVLTRADIGTRRAFIFIAQPHGYLYFDILSQPTMGVPHVVQVLFERVPFCGAVTCEIDRRLGRGLHRRRQGQKLVLLVRMSPCDRSSRASLLTFLGTTPWQYRHSEAEFPHHPLWQDVLSVWLRG